eukprot:gene29746-37092_t
MDFRCKRVDFPLKIVVAFPGTFAEEARKFGRLTNTADSCHGHFEEQLPGGPMAAGVEASSRSASQVVSCQSNAAGKAGQAPSAFAGSGSLKSSWQHGSYGSLIEKLNEENVSAPFGHEQQITLGRGREGALARRRRTMTEHSEDFVEIKQSVRAATARVPPAVEDPVPLQQQQPGALLGRPNQGAQTTLGASLHVGEPKPAESSTTPAAPAHTPAWVGSGYLKLIEKANEMSIDQRKRENVVKYHTPHEQHISLRRHDENDSLRRRTLNEHLDDTEEILQFKQSVRAATARVPPAVEAPVPLQQQQPGALLGRPNQGAQTTLGASLHVGEPKLAESSATPVAPAHTPEPCRTDQPESVAKNAEIHLRESHTLKSQRDPPSTSRGPGEEPTSEQATLAMHRQWRQLQEQLFMPGPSQLQLLSVHEPTKIHQYPLQQREQLDSQLKEKRMQAPQIGQIIPASLMLQQQAGQLQGQQGQPHLSSDMLGQQAGQQAGYLPLSRQLVQGQQARQMPSLSMQMQGQQAGQLQGQQALTPLRSALGASWRDFLRGDPDRYIIYLAHRRGGNVIRCPLGKRPGSGLDKSIICRGSACVRLLSVDDSGMAAERQAFDKDYISKDDFIGRVDIELGPLLNKGIVEGYTKLHSNRGGKQVPGELLLKVNVVHVPSVVKHENMDVLVGTWNVGESAPSDDLSSWLKGCHGGQHHIVAI